MSQLESATPQQPQQMLKRQVCYTCNFPTRTCICKALPSEPLAPLFQRCRIVVLQHPHELRRKNRSLPLVDLCLFGKSNGEKNETNSTSQSTSLDKTNQDFVMRTVVGRRFGDQCDEAVLRLLRDPNEVVVAVFPHPQALDLEKGIRLADERCGLVNDNSESTSNNATDTRQRHKKITLVFIDATWKYAKEMDKSNSEIGKWPENLIRVQMTPSETISNNTNDASTDTKINSKTFVQRRFQIRAPPSPDHLSTAECLAWVASYVERNPVIYEKITKLLDYIVDIWKGFSKDEKSNGGWDSMTQKKRKITQNKVNGD